MKVKQLVVLSIEVPGQTIRKNTEDLEEWCVDKDLAALGVDE